MANTQNTEQLIQQIEQLNQRIDNLEARNAFQDDIVDKLNHELAIHQEKIADFDYQIGIIADRLKNIQGGAVAKQEDETPPPHY